MKGLRSAFGLLSVIGGAAPPDPTAVKWFPIVGLVIGTTTGLAHWGAGRFGGPAPAAGVALVVDAVLTGLLHYDGVVDSADGLLPQHLSRERRLEVMSEPTVGGFGSVSGSLLVVVRALMISALIIGGSGVAAFALAGVMSRYAMVWVLETLEPARPGGLGAAFRGEQRRSWLAIPVAVLAVAGTSVYRASIGWGAATGLIGAALCAYAIRRRAKRVLGGYTGDVLGATCLLTETALLAGFALFAGGGQR